MLCAALAQIRCIASIRNGCGTGGWGLACVGCTLCAYSASDEHTSCGMVQRVAKMRVGTAQRHRVSVLCSFYSCFLMLCSAQPTSLIMHLFCNICTVCEYKHLHCQLAVSGLVHCQQTWSLAAEGRQGCMQLLAMEVVCRSGVVFKFLGPELAPAHHASPATFAFSRSPQRDLEQKWCGVRFHPRECVSFMLTCYSDFLSGCGGYLLSLISSEMDFTRALFFMCWFCFMRNQHWPCRMDRKLETVVFPAPSSLPSAHSMHIIAASCLAEA